ADAALAARRRAERRVAEQPRAPASPIAECFRAEADRARRAGPAPQAAPQVPAGSADAEMLARERSMTAALAPERAAEQAAERAAALERQLEDQADRVARAYEAIAQLRAQLAALHPGEESGPRPARPAPAPAGSAPLTADLDPPAPVEARTAVDPERLNAA